MGALLICTSYQCLLYVISMFTSLCSHAKFLAEAFLQTLFRSLGNKVWALLTPFHSFIRFFNFVSYFDIVQVFKGCVCYIFTSLFCKSKREDLWNKKKCFLFHLESSFRSWDNQGRHQLPRHETRNAFFWITWEVDTVW